MLPKKELHRSLHLIQRPTSMPISLRGLFEVSLTIDVLGTEDRTMGHD